MRHGRCHCSTSTKQLNALQVPTVYRSLCRATYCIRAAARASTTACRQVVHTPGVRSRSRRSTPRWGTPWPACWDLLPSWHYRCEKHTAGRTHMPQAASCITMPPAMPVQQQHLVFMAASQHGQRCWHAGHDTCMKHVCTPGARSRWCLCMCHCCRWWSSCWDLLCSRHHRHTQRTAGHSARHGH